MFKIIYKKYFNIFFITVYKDYFPKFIKYQYYIKWANYIYLNIIAKTK